MSARDWLRSNRVALIAVAALIPACGALVFGVPWADYASRIPDRQVAQVGRAVDFAGIGWTLEKTAEFPGTGEQGNGIPLDSSLVAALVTVVPDPDADEPPFCQFELTQDPGAPNAERRSWTQLGNPRDYRYGLGEDSATYCDPDRTGPYVLELVFLVPDGVYGDAFIEVQVGARRDRVLALPMAQ